MDLPTPVSRTPSLSRGTFDLADLRLTQAFDVELGLKALPDTPSVRRPLPTWYIRTRPGEEYRLDTYAIQEEDEPYHLVAKSVAEHLEGESALKLYRFQLAMNRRFEIFVWPIRLSLKSEVWCTSALMAVEAAASQWVRVCWDHRQKAYKTQVAAAIGEEPQWPEEAFGETLSRAFGDRYIDSTDHPVLRRLRGDI